MQRSLQSTLDIYEQNYKTAYIENRQILKKQIENDSFLKNDKQLNKKIDNFCQKYQLDKNTVIIEIKKSEVVQAFFSKDPKKQNIHEKTASSIIQEIPDIQKFKNLPNNSLYLVSGGVMDKKEKQKGFNTETKTIDFQWEYKGSRFYASHKYTKESGGSQDNQYKNLESFIKEANQSTKTGEYFIAIADGEYYQKTRDGKKKIDLLKEEANSSKGVYACSIDELPDLLQTIKNTACNTN